MGAERSRTKKTLLNAGSSLLNKGLTYILQFVSRTVFVYTLSSEYLGISALFSSIITLLSLADLGFGIALPQSLYKPLQENDEDKICSLIKYYAKVYRCIAAVVVLIGIALLPFLGLIIKQENMAIPNIRLIYLLFIAQSSISYLFVYKRSLITADQKNYIVVTLDSIISILTTIVQIVILLITRNYILYLIVAVISTFIKNLVSSAICDKYYPFLKTKREIKKLDSAETKSLSKKIYALFIYKLASSIETGTDNIIITAIFGVVLTGYCSNYTLITTSIAGILMMVMAAAVPSIGNLIVQSNKMQTHKVYDLLNFISFWVYGVCSICTCLMIESCIVLWLGNEYTIPFSIAVMLCMNMYISGVQNVNSNFRNAYGLFYEGRYRPVLMILTNIVSSILLAKVIGITGVFAGTLLSRILTVGTFDPYIVHKYGLQRPLKSYYTTHLAYHAATFAVGAGLYFLLLPWQVNSFFMWILKAAVVFIATNACFALLFARNRNFLELLQRIKGILHGGNKK